MQIRAIPRRRGSRPIKRRPRAGARPTCRPTRPARTSHRSCISLRSVAADRRPAVAAPLLAHLLAPGLHRDVELVVGDHAVVVGVDRSRVVELHAAGRVLELLDGDLAVAVGIEPLAHALGAMLAKVSAVLGGGSRRNRAGADTRECGRRPTGVLARRRLRRVLRRRGRLRRRIGVALASGEDAQTEQHALPHAYNVTTAETARHPLHSSSPRADNVVHVRIALAITSSLAFACACQDKPKDSAPRLPRLHGEGEQTDTEFEMTTHDSPPPVTLGELVARGKHWRLETPHGPVHVWIPGGYNRRRAETIVYVHGYYVHVDDAWENYRLATQFASSAINAVFIAPEGPAGPNEKGSWESLGPLLDAVEQGLDQKLPRRRVVTIGHSAAYRTLLGWLDEPLLDTVVLVDAAYGEIDQYKAWINADDKHRLIDVGDDTRAWTDQLHKDLPETVVLESFPTLEDGVPREAARARILYIKSNLGHFPLITGGVALPMILLTLRAKRLVREPLAEILDSPAE